MHLTVTEIGYGRDICRDRCQLARNEGVQYCKCFKNLNSEYLIFRVQNLSYIGCFYDDKERHVMHKKIYSLHGNKLCLGSQGSTCIIDRLSVLVHCFVICCSVIPSLCNLLDSA
jgi:hypothetical protein